ncbi:MAG: terpene cyclase/mutase family protein [Verrucomicrobia bacterium]|nr:terpene cyclase/mutase family protein [Verrucomicrobiota bacterium]
MKSHPFIRNQSPACLVRTAMRPAANRRMATAAALVWLAAAAILPAQTVTEDDKYQRAFDEAVDRGLAFLARGQAVTGAIGNQAPATTSLAIMAFLARGYTPGLPPYGDVLDRAIDSVLTAQSPEWGNITGNMYHHNISTLMLSEVSGMTDPERQRRIGEALAKAVRVTLASQAVQKDERHAGGWRYDPKAGDSDLSHSGWGMMALRSARNNGAPVPKEAVDRAARYILRCRSNEAEKGFGYQAGEGTRLTCTGIGLLCLELAGYHRDEITLKAGQHLLTAFEPGKNPDFGEFRYYGYYYCANGMFQLGGEQWEQFAPRIYDAILTRQKPDGAWQGDGQEGDPGYATAMAVLALSVSYRQLPIYQR